MPRCWSGIFALGTAKRPDSLSSVAASRRTAFQSSSTAAITESLAGAELFGHARGAFTGAERDHRGFCEQADGGTLFLDELGDMPLAAQGKILRPWQQRVVQPVGSARTIDVDVRVFSVTHQDLERSVSEGHFHQDL